MLDKPASALRIRERLIESERLMDETGCYDGITELALRNQDPLKFETLHTKLRAYCVSAREMARRISASPGVREVGEMVVAIYTPEGDAIALSNGIMVHVHTMSRFIKWMIRNGYEENPRIRDGDIFANNDAFIGTVQVPDVMDVVPIFHYGKLVGWAGAVCHELEAGGITPGGDVAWLRSASPKACSSAPKRSARTTRSGATTSFAVSAICACRSTGSWTRRPRSPPASTCARASKR